MYNIKSSNFEDIPKAMERLMTKKLARWKKIGPFISGMVNAGGWKVGKTGPGHVDLTSRLSNR